MLNIPEEIKDLFRTDNLSEMTRRHIKLRFYDEDIRLLFPEDTLFPSDALFPIDQEPSYIIDNSQIEYESLVITESICDDEDLIFGECEAAQLEIIVADVFQDLTGKEFMATVEIGGYEMALGIYHVDSFVRQADRRKKKIIAYNRLVNFQTDVSKWYHGLIFPMSLKVFRESLCDFIGITQIECSLPLDDLQITKTIDPEQLSGLDVLQAICEINGCFGQIDKTGRLKYVFLERSGLYPAENLFPDDELFPTEMESGEILSYYKQSETSYEDYVVAPIDRVQIRQEEGDIGAMFGSGNNCYVIQGNFLVYGKTGDELLQIASIVYEQIGGRSYRPCKIVSPALPWVEVGDGIICYTTDDVIETYCLKRTIKGIQAMTDTYEASGNIELEENFGIQTQIIQLEGKTAIIKKSVEEVSVRVTDLKNYTEAQFKITADEIAAEVRRAQNAEAALSIRADQISLSVKNLKEDTESKFRLTADEIAAEVRRAQNAEATLSIRADQIVLSVNDLRTDTDSQFRQTATQIALKVSKGDVSSQLSIEPDEINLKTNRLSWESDYSTMTRDGKLTCQNIRAINGYFSGELETDVFFAGDNFVQFGDFYVTADGSNILRSSDGSVSIQTAAGGPFGSYTTIYLDSNSGHTELSDHHLETSFVNTRGINGDCELVGNNWWSGYTLFEALDYLYNKLGV